MLKHPRHIPTRDTMEGLLLRLLPGSSSRARALRCDVLDFVSSPASRAVHVRGPVGGGKSTLARIIGLLKRVAPLRIEEAHREFENLRFDGPNRIDLRCIQWYVEMAITGLVPGLAEAQLFGVVKGGYTGAEARLGIFAQAARGRMPAGQDPPDGARLTGGVVFLDEIGDLAADLQAKLLPVLSGAPFFPVGAEGSQASEQIFRGVTVTASWKHLEEVLRPDLLSRISSCVIDVPSVEDRMEDFDALFEGIENTVIHTAKEEIARALREERRMDRPFWEARSAALQPASPEVRRRFAAIGWGAHGNLRGLTGALERVLVGGEDSTHVLATLARLPSDRVPATRRRDDLLSRLLDRTGDGSGLAGHVKELEVEQRERLSEALLTDATARRRLSEALAIGDTELLAQIHQLARRRRAQKGGQS